MTAPKAIWLCALLLAASTRALSAQDAPDRFLIQVAGGALTGSEEYRIEKTDTGYRLTGKSVLNQMGRETQMKQELILGRDWALEHYMLEASMMGRTTMMEAARQDQQVKMTAGMGGEVKSETVPLAPRTLVLDNVIGSHYQILLNIMGANADAGGEIFALVPQRLLRIRGILSASQKDTGVMAGKSIALRKYALEIGNVLVEFWAEADTNRLMRLAVPLQKVEMVREGFTPHSPAAVESKEPPVWSERTLTFASGTLQVPATLCLPTKAAGKPPIVIMVHGSGPNDRDETIGPNKPFLDIAHGLAGSGIATLRYDKRTFAFKQQIDARMLTLEQEVTDDAVAALEFAKTLPEVNPQNIFILGHSMGGMMAPFVAGRFPALRGVVMMAAAARPLDKLILEQVAFQMKATGAGEADIAKKVEDMRDAFARIRSGDATDFDMIMYASARYWREIFKLDVPAALGGLKVPVLALQGGKDVQVGKIDFDMIEKSIAGFPEARRESHYFPNLNHLFMEVAGQPTGAEYGRAGKVDEGVIRAICSWIRRQAAVTGPSN